MLFVLISWLLCCLDLVDLVTREVFCWFCRTILGHDYDLVCRRQKQSSGGVLRNFAKFTVKHLGQSLFFNKVASLRPEASNFIKKETLAQVFSCEFCETSKNTFFYRTPLVAASEHRKCWYCFKQKFNVLNEIFAATNLQVPEMVSGDKQLFFLLLMHRF